MSLSLALELFTSHGSGEKLTLFTGKQRRCPDSAATGKLGEAACKASPQLSPSPLAATADLPQTPAFKWLAWLLATRVHCLSCSLSNASMAAVGSSPAPSLSPSTLHSFASSPQSSPPAESSQEASSLFSPHVPATVLAGCVGAGAGGEGNTVPAVTLSLLSVGVEAFFTSGGGGRICVRITRHPLGCREQAARLQPKTQRDLWTCVGA